MLEEKCAGGCNNTSADDLRYDCRIAGGDYSECVRVANALANLILNENAVNTTWSVSQSGVSSRDGIVNYLDYLSDDLQGKLLAKGLDLNQSYGRHSTPFTWLLGNAQNDLVSQLLESAKYNQTKEQRLVWINKTDSMARSELDDNSVNEFCFGLFEADNMVVSDVHQTPLQLCIAKGYTNKTGSGKEINSSCFQIAEKLLALGANEGINYQEPTKGNTALHIAYTKRDFAAITLLEANGALQNVFNFEGDKPADMLDLSFEQANKLLAFHTSPDGHPATFRLEQNEFQNVSNLEQIKEGVHVARSFFESKGKETVLPGNPFFFGGLTSQVLQGHFTQATNLIAGGASSHKAKKILEDKLDLLSFIQEDNPLHLQQMPWDEYNEKRNELDAKHINSLNPYMYDLTEQEYAKHQQYITQNKEQFTKDMASTAQGIKDFIGKLIDAHEWLKPFVLKDSVMNSNHDLTDKLIEEGVDFKTVNTMFQQELAALNFKKSLGVLVQPLFNKEITWDTYTARLLMIYNSGGGESNPFLPNFKSQITKTDFDEMIADSQGFREEDMDELQKINAGIEQKISKIEKAMQVLELIVYPASLNKASEQSQTASINAKAADVKPVVSVSAQKQLKETIQQYRLDDADINSATPSIKK